MGHRRTSSESWSSRDLRTQSTGVSLDDACLRVVDVGLWAVVFVAPLLFGGRHNLGRFVFVALCVVISLAWFIRQAVLGNGTWTRSAASAVMLLALAVVGAQLVPLPSDWIESLSPRIATLLPLWSAESSEALEWGRWQTLSLAPEETRLALATLVAYALLFTTTLQRVRTTADVRRMFRWIALSAIFMAGFGLLQYFSSNGRFFWFYDYPYSSTTDSTTGSFSCRNHFAHFLCLGIAALIAWIAEHLNAGTTTEESRLAKHRPPSKPALQSISQQTRTTAALVAGLAVVVCAVLLSYSRGAAVALAVVAVVTALLYYRSRLISAGHLLGALGIVVLVVGMLSIHGYEKVAHRVDDFATGSLESLDERGGRRKIWQANVEAIQAGWQTGAGAGSHRFIYPVYMSDPTTREFTHAENGPLQIITENGLPGGVLLAWFACCCGIWCWGAFRRERQSSARIFAGAITAALLASLIHSLFDFIWFVPACVAVTLIMAACALRLARLNRAEAGHDSREIVLPRPAWIGVAALASVAGLWAVATSFGPACASLPWDRYQRLAIAENELQDQSTPLSTERAAEIEETLHFYNLARIDELRQVVSRQPRHSSAHLKLAGSYLRQFERNQTRSENQMRIVSIRDAAMASRFANADELRQWLVRAFGENSKLLYRAYHHLRCSIQLSPLEGESYLLMANLCFLQGKGAATIQTYVDQALAVRPYDGNVLFLAGRQQLLLSRDDEAIRYWTAAFKIAGEHQDEIIRYLAVQVPASYFLQKIEPDWEKLYDIWTYYRQVGTQQDWEAIESYARDCAAADSEHLPPELAVRTWLRLGMMQRELGRNTEAVASLSKGNVVHPNHFHIRHHLALALMDLHQAEAAEPHLRWCLSRRPDYGELRDALKLATRIRLGREPVTERSTAF